MILERFCAACLMAVLSIQIFAQTNRQTPQSSIQGAPLPPRFLIVDIGVLPGNFMGALGMSPGGVAVGRALPVNGNSTQGFYWTRTGGLVGLPNLAGFPHCRAEGANDGGLIAGTCALNFQGQEPRPVTWSNGTVTQMTPPPGNTLGQAHDINASNIAVGSTGSGTNQVGVIYTNGIGGVITQTTANGSFFRDALRVNDAGRVVGFGIDPNVPGRNVGIVYDIGSSSAFEVGAIPGANGAIAFGVSPTGAVVGSSGQGQQSGRPFIWTQAGGIQAIPLPPGTSSGVARDANSAGHVVGISTSTFSIPFYYDGTNTYRLQDIIQANSGWDLSTNTFASAYGISESGIIFGGGVINDEIRTFVMIPVTAATTFDFDGDSRTDPAVYRSGTWLLNGSTAGYSQQNFGLATDRLAPADYDGDGKTDIAVWRETEGNFYIIQSSNNSVRIENFGLSGDVLTVGDWDGDGKADLSTYREGAQSNFYYRGSLNNPGGNITYLPWGTSGDKAVHGDFDGDRKFDTAIFRPSNQTWFIRQSSDNQIVYRTLGLASDKRVSGDFDGDGKTDICLFRDGVWYIWQSSNNQIRYQNWGLNSDTIVAGDYDGDGKTDVAVWRNGIYYILNSGNSSISYQSFGINGDRPVAAAFIQ